MASAEALFSRKISASPKINEKKEVMEDTTTKSSHAESKTENNNSQADTTTSYVSIPDTFITRNNHVHSGEILVTLLCTD